MTWRDCKAELGQEAQGKLSAKAETAPRKQGPGHHVLDFAPLHPIPPQHSFPILLEKTPNLLWRETPPTPPLGSTLRKLSTELPCPPPSRVVPGPPCGVAHHTVSLGTGFWAKGCRGEKAQSPSHPEDTVSLPLPVDSTSRRFLGPAPPQPVLRLFHQSPEHFCAYTHCQFCCR